MHIRTNESFVKTDDTLVAAQEALLLVCEADDETPDIDGSKDVS